MPLVRLEPTMGDPDRAKHANSEPQDSSLAAKCSME